ncbi:MAG TPA: hypothetical protein PKL73_24385 [Polyangiaceae bacterium]|jgi:hypothetical protein|nr:MAG: hypothetical protein BWY17_02482 [Deltaproteobacteria bacterium ADurb.Bin207]HNT00121.1 hypothetical protein [Polyangiaceae bacterium]HNZ23334.1 hypothetical protein [Polyangiaceae bacterium]HOD21896.1 hypothetical protein [Polyangiaceae bacterium]HOE49341.1 hypothetical protein [Polyangiaceae bacterium]
MGRKRGLIWASVVVLVGLGAWSCSDDSGGNGKASKKELDWFTSSCADLGGVETPAGACFIGCKTNDDCGLPTLRCTGTAAWSVGQCEISYEIAQTRGCGPKGWHQRSYGCYMQCFGGNDDECPSGFRCLKDSIHAGDYFCSGYSGGSSSDCSVPCERGCCSPTGRTCCEPPFCSGICSGSPCCR